MGFSIVGLLLSLAVLAPNLLLLAFPPRDPLPAVVVPWPLTWLERAGQGLCLVVPVITVPGTIVWGWGMLVLGGLLAYYGLWGRYLRQGRRGVQLYAPLGVLPVPMAVFPVVVFLAAGAWLSNPWIAGAGLILGAGHIPSAILIGRTIAAQR